MASSITELKQKIENILNSLKPQKTDDQNQILNDRNQILNITQTICSLQLTLLAEYLDMIALFKTIEQFFNQLGSELSVINAEDVDENGSVIILQLPEHYKNLKIIRIKQFLAYILANKNDLEKILFADVTRTEPDINKHYKLLALHFHTDKAPSEEVKAMFTEVFQLILQKTQSMLKKLKEKISTSDALEYYVGKGKRNWDKAKDYENSTSPTYTYRVINRERIRNLSSEELEKKKTIYALKSIQYYRAALLKMRNVANLENSIILRKNIIKCYMLCGLDFILETEVYILGAVYMITRKSTTLNIYSKHLQDMKQLLQEVHGTKTTKQDVGSNANSHSSSVQQSLVALNNGKDLSIEKRKAFLREINQEIYNSIQDFMVLGDGRIVEKTASKENIKNMKIMGAHYKTFGAGMMGVGVFGGISMLGYGSAAAGLEIAVVATTTATVTSLSVIAIPVVIAVGGLFGLLLGGVGGYIIFKEGRRLWKEPKIRENLNQIIESALKCYSERKYEELFLELAKKFVDKKPDAFERGWRKIFRSEKIEGDDSLIKFEKGKSLEIVPGNIVRVLLEHEFRPDGIAYVMILIGDALLRYKFDAGANVSRNECYSKAIELFKTIFDTETNDLAKALNNEAKNLDELVLKAKENRIWFFQKLLVKYNVPKEYIKAFEEGSFAARLSEVTRYARINCAICYILNSDIEIAKRLLKDVKESLSEPNNFFGFPETRIQALDDWIFALDDHDDDYFTQQFKSIENYAPSKSLGYQ